MKHMPFTKLAMVLGALLLAFFVWLALMGLRIASVGLVTVFMLFVLVAGGNLLSARRSGPRREPRPLHPTPPTPGRSAPEDAGGTP